MSPDSTRPERTDRPGLRSEVERMTALLAAQPGAGRVRPWTSVELEGGLVGVSRFTQYGLELEFRSDEAVDRGGSASAPSPMRYLLSGVGFCLAGWCAKTWALHDVPLRSLKVEVRSALDMRGEHLVDDTPAHPLWLVIDARVTDDADAARAIELLREAARRCPLSALVERAIPLYLMLEHNGITVLDERPHDLRTEKEEEQTR